MAFTADSHRIVYLGLDSALFGCIMNFVLPLFLALFSLWLWHWNKTVIRLFLFSMGLSFTALLIPIVAGQNVFWEDVCHTVLYVLNSMAFVLIFWRILTDIDLTRKISYPVASFLFYVLWFPSILVIAYYVSYQAVLSEDTLMIILQTNLREAAEFVRIHFMRLCVGLVVFLIPLVVLIKNRFQETCRIKFYYSLVALCMIVGIVYSGTMIVIVNAYPMTIFRNVIWLQDYHLDMEEIHHPPLKRSKDKQLWVVVIGESAVRDKMGVYGYKEKNTPWLDGVKNKILFTNAYSSNTYTIGVLPYLLTSSSQYGEKGKFSIIDTAKLAGYKTYWISNQEKFGNWGTNISNITSKADFTKWNEMIETSIHYKTKYYDEQLLETVKELSFTEDSLVFLHLMGSHQDYDQRYPRSFAKFEKSYDNTILYTDYVLQQTYEYFSQKPHFSGMIYLSDHGESESDRSHNPDLFEWNMVRIPFFIIVSNSYKENHKELVNILIQHRDKYWTNDLFYDMMNNLLGIKDIPEYKKEWDISDISYKGTKENTFTKNGNKSIKEEPQN